MISQPLRFPNDFLWGTASAAHQNEGNNTNNQWWAFEQQPDTIWGGRGSGLAADWWRHAERDFDHMQRLGLNALRLSVEWSRIEPEPGCINHAALDRYRELLGALRERGLQPLVTLHHFTNPLWFERRGAWEQPESVARFQHFVHHTIQALGDLCDFWLTFNEPVVYAVQSYLRGVWPPRKASFPLTITVIRHLLRAHAAAYETIHALRPDHRVGYAKQMRLMQGRRPGNDLDRYAAGLRRYLFEHIWFMATIDGRIRPPMGTGLYQHTLADSFDFIGINYYTRDLVRFELNPEKLFGDEMYPPDYEFSAPIRTGRPFSEFYPQGLARACREVSELGKPIYITENGLPDADDSQRPRWLLAHLHQLHRAIEAGADVRGYFHWTFVDNFEWDQGWNLPFGLVELDPVTQARRERGSARLYSAIARQNGMTPRMVEEYAPGLL